MMNQFWSSTFYAKLYLRHIDLSGAVAAGLRVLLNYIQLHSPERYYYNFFMHSVGIVKKSDEDIPISSTDGTQGFAGFLKTTPLEMIIVLLSFSLRYEERVSVVKRTIWVTYHDATCEVVT